MDTVDLSEEQILDVSIAHGAIDDANDVTSDVCENKTIETTSTNGDTSLIDHEDDDNVAMTSMRRGTRVRSLPELIMSTAVVPPVRRVTLINSGAKSAASITSLSVASKDVISVKKVCGCIVVLLHLSFGIVRSIVDFCVEVF